MSSNPFLGPQPYRAADRDRFFGRDEVTRSLANHILATPCLTLFGTSGAGKSSLMQAGVIPYLEEAHDFRTVRIEGWLASDAPLERLVQTLFMELELVPLPERLSPRRELELAVDLAEQRSDRPILIHLDQLEQLFLPGRDTAQTGAFLEGLHALASKPVRGLQLVLSLREDYLGRFQDRARGRRELLEQGFRLGPLTVGEMAKVACRIAESGTPKQTWSESQLRELMLQVRVTGQDAREHAEVQAAFAQIVCRALWEEPARLSASGPVLAEPLLHRYQEATLEGLGSLKEHAQRLLEAHLIDRDGSRMLLMEQSARKVLASLSSKDASRVLRHLEDAAVLHAQEHHGSRYFELGHDWLAHKVFERREDRIRREEEERRFHQEQAQAEEKAAQARERARRKRAAFTTGLAVTVALLMTLLLMWAMKKRDEARLAHLRAREYALIAGARELLARGQSAMASKMLLEVAHPSRELEWAQLALDALVMGIPVLTRHCHETSRTASFSSDGRYILVTGEYEGVQVWQADGLGDARTIAPGEQVTLATFSPDSKRVLTISTNGTAQVWSLDGTRNLAVFKRANASLAAFSPSGERLIISTAAPGSSVSKEYLWHADGSDRFEELPKPLFLTKATSVAFSPDEKYIAVAYANGTARVVQLNGPLKIYAELSHQSAVLSISFHPKDGKFVLTASSDKTARVWRLDRFISNTLEPVHEATLEGHAKAVVSAAFSPDGNQIVTASADGTARVWRMNGTLRSELKGYENELVSAVFSPDGTRVVTASVDGTARVWRAGGSGVPLIVRRHEGKVLSAVFSPNGKQLLTTSTDGTARVWQVDGSLQPTLLEGHEKALTSAAFSSHGELVVTTSLDGTARVWPVDSPDAVQELRAHQGAVASAAFSPDGSQLVTASWDSTARLWWLDDPDRNQVLEGHTDKVVSATFSSDGKTLVTASWDRTARVWWPDDPSKNQATRAHGDKVVAAALTPDKKYVVTASWDKTARVWLAYSLDPMLHGKGLPEVNRQNHELEVESIALSRDGTYVVSTSRDGTALLWETRREVIPRSLEGHEGAVVSAAFSPNLQYVVTSSSDRTARIWPVKGESRPVVLRGHEQGLVSATFAPDGQYVVTASLDGTARVWSADGSRQPLVLQAHTGALMSAAFSPDGKYIVTASTDKTARVWPVSTSELQHVLQGANKDCLPADMRRTYLDESADQAQDFFKECERSYGRTSSTVP